MRTSSRTDVRACPHCRLTTASRSASRRHQRLDHRPAHDGARLVAQIVDPPTDGLPPVEGRTGWPVPRPAATAPSRLTPARTASLTVLLGIAVVAAVLEPLALVLLAFASAGWVRRHALRRLDERQSSGPRRAQPHRPRSS